MIKKKKTVKKTAKKSLKTVEGHKEKILVSRSDYIISTEGGKTKRYLKTDPSVISVLNDKGIKKFYLKTDPMVTKVDKGYFILTSDAVYCECIKKYVDPATSRIEKIDGKYYLQRNTVVINGKRQYYDEEVICRDYLASRTTYAYKKDCVKLHPELYGLNKYTVKPSINQLPVVTITNKYKGETYYAREADSTRVMSTKGDVLFYSADHAGRLGMLSSCFVGFVNEELKTLDNNNVKRGYCLRNEDNDEKIFKFHSKTDRYVHVNDWERYDTIYKEWYEYTLKKSVKKAVDKANANFSDREEGENIPSFMRFDRSYKPRWGGNIGYDGRRQFSVSSTAVQTGGMNYTFGVEIETSDGFLSEAELRSSGLCSMGDNSILGNEYITQALHGDVGVNALRTAMETVSGRCVVDDTCSIHVHVGGWKNSKVWTPNFNVNFAINAIKLGCAIEEDLFRTQPSSRSPWKKHCHCITSDDGDYSGDFREISKENYKKLLGRYVFGRTIDRDVNSMATPGRWADMRYKWLNLRNAVANTEIDTIEFRIFSPTTKFDKVLQAVRIALAFTWFVENRQGLISKGNVTLKSMLTEAYERHPLILSEVINYVDSRTKKFNRKNVY